MSPTSTAVLATVGLVLIHTDLYARQTAFAVASDARLRLPPGLDQLGAIAVGLAVLPLLIGRVPTQIFVSPLVVAVILVTYTYTNVSFIIIALLVAITLWWITRIRPAAAYADPHHPASVLAADLEPATAATG
jgi:hypothetical protein